MSMLVRAALGAPLAISLSAVIAFAQAPNDLCANAIALNAGLNGPYSNVGANTELAWPCGNGGADLWFTHTATCSGPISFDTCNVGTNFDTTIEVLTNDCNNPISLGCNDDSCFRSSTAVINATLGTTYLVRVGGYAGARFGNFLVDIRCTSLPANDECTGAITVFDGTNGIFSNVNSTDSMPFPCEPTGGSDVWFRYQATCSGPVAFDTCSANTTFDTVIEVFDGACAALNPLGCDDDTCNETSGVVVIQATTGGIYFVRVGGWAQRQGTFNLNVNCVTLPSNDECTGSIPLSTGLNGPFNNRYSTSSQPAWNCGNGGSDVWFSYFATCSTTVTIDLCTAFADFDTVLEVMTGPCNNQFGLICNDDACGRASSVQFASTINTIYYVRVGGYNAKQGNFEVNVSLAGTGSYSTLTTGCGQATITASGTPNLGSDVQFQIDNEVGTPFLWIGLPLGVPLCPPATCTIGATFESIIPGDSLRAMIPCDPTLRGGNVLIQGADFGGIGGCPAPLQISFTNTIQVTIG